MTNNSVLPRIALLVILLPVFASAHPQQLTVQAEFVPQMGPDGACAHVAFSPDSKFVATSSLNGAHPGTTVQLWETATGRLIRNLRLQTRAYVSTFYEDAVDVFSPDGKYLVLFDPVSPAGAPTAQTILTQWATANIWEISTGRQLIHSDWRFDPTKKAAVNPDMPWDSSEILSWIRPANDEAKKWDAQHPWPNEKLPFLEPQVALSADGQYLARVNGYGELWNVREQRQIQGFCSSQVTTWKSLSLSKHNSLAAGSPGKRFIVWGLSSSSGPRAADVMPPTVFTTLKSVAISPDGKAVATATRTGSTDAKGKLYFYGETALWNGESLEKQHPVPTDAYSTREQFARPTMSLAFSLDGSRLVSGMITESRGGEPSDYVEYQGLLKMWDTTNDNLIWKRMLPDGDLTSVAFSPDGKLVATGLLGVLVKLYDAASSSRVRFFDDKQAVVSDLLLEAGEASVLSLAFSPDGKMLASGGSTGHLFVWDVQTGKQLAHLSEPHYDTSLEVVYRYGPEPPPRPGATRESIEALAFSADGKRLYSAGCEGAISVWETKDWKQTAAIAAAEGRCIRALAITNDGKWLVSAAEDGQIIFWNIITNKLVARLLVAADTNDWLIVAANGLYDGTEAAINSLAAWRIGNRLVSMTSLPPQFHVKGLLLKVLAEETPNSAMDLQQLLNSRE